jgi:hypothetical protein
MIGITVFMRLQEALLPTGGVLARAPNVSYRCFPENDVLYPNPT